MWLVVGRTVLRGFKQSCSEELLFVIAQGKKTPKTCWSKIVGSLDGIFSRPSKYQMCRNYPNKLRGMTCQNKVMEGVTCKLEQDISCTPPMLSLLFSKVERQPP